MARRPLALCFMLVIAGALLLVWSPTATAELTSQSERLYPVCTNPDLCQLSGQAIGESVISGSSPSATPASPVTVRREFTMLPTQGDLAMLPMDLKELLIDLRIQEDPTSFSQPDLVVDLRLGDSWNQWTIQGSGFGLPEQQTPYSLTDARLDLDNGRILKPNAPVVLTLTFRLDRPVTWELHLAGDSWFDLPIEWSLDPDAVNVDEPSSLTSPRSVDLGHFQYGALIGPDIDCFSFSLPDDLAAFTVHVQWDVAPVEVEQSHHTPTMETSAGLSNPAPEIRTTVEAGETRSEIRWAQPRSGEQHLCWQGEADRYQAYKWIGRQTQAGIGATSPDEFTGIAAWPTGEGWTGSVDRASGPAEQGVGLLLFGGFFSALAGLAMALPSGAWWTRKIAIPFALVLILAGGIASPAWALTSSMPKSGEQSLDEYLVDHVALVGDSVATGDPLPAAGFLGTAAGDTLRLRLHIYGAHPTDDGRWQLHAKEADAVRIDELVYHELARNSFGDSDGIAFMLRASRQVAFDLLMLEALLVVDEKPAANVLHIEWRMVDAKAVGSETNPVWTTRPSEVSGGEWNRLVRDLYPELMTISYCDCGLDSLDISIRGNSALDSGDLTTPDGLRLSEGLFPYASWLLAIGVLLLVGSQMHSRAATREARRLAEEYGVHLTERHERRRREEEAAVTAAVAAAKVDSRAARTTDTNDEESTAPTPDSNTDDEDDVELVPDSGHPLSDDTTAVIELDD